MGNGTHLDFNSFMDVVASEASEQGVKLIAKRKKLLQTSLAFRDESAEPVIKRVHKLGNREPDPIRGLVEAIVNGPVCCR